MIVRLWTSFALGLLVVSFWLPAFAQDKNSQQDGAAAPKKKIEKKRTVESTTTKTDSVTKKTDDRTKQAPGMTKSTKRAHSVQQDEQGVPDIQKVLGVAMAQIGRIEQGLSDGTKFSPKANASDAKVVAVMAQIAAEHEDDAPLKKSGPAFRDAALRLSKAKTAAEAQKAIDQIKKINPKSPPKAELEYDWSKLIDVPTVMEQMKNQNAKLKEVIEKGDNRFGQAAKPLIILASLGRALQKIDPGLKEKQDREDWNKFAVAFTQKTRSSIFDGELLSMGTLKSDLPEINKSCTNCHAKFKKQTKPQ